MLEWKVTSISVVVAVVALVVVAITLVVVTNITHTCSHPIAATLVVVMDLTAEAIRDRP